MQDDYGRNINYLRLSITDACNCRCIYCVDSNKQIKYENSKLLTLEELVNIGKIAIECGINKIRITGGEPLLRQDLLRLCERLKKIKGLEELAITTNGSRLANMAVELKAVGVDRLNISLDTLNADKFKLITKIGDFDTVWSGINSVMKAGFTNTKINVVLMRGINDDEIVDFVNLTKDNPISVRFIELMPIGPCRECHNEYFISSKEVYEKVPELTKLGQDGVSELYKLRGALGTVGLISPISACFCDTCNRLRVTADGRLLPCLHSDLEYNVSGLSDEELTQIFQLAIKNKPKGHYISENHASDNCLYMNKIGG